MTVPKTIDPDFWFYTIGVNAIPATSMIKIPKVEWKEWQDKPIPKEVYEDWKKSSAFKAGCAIITGLIWRGEFKGKYLACIDIDNAKGIEAFLSKFGKTNTLEKIAENTIVEQHLDAKDKKAHVYFVVEKPLSKKSGIDGPPNSLDQEIPAIEVKSEGKHGIMYCSPSVHKNGHPYQIIGSRTPTVLNEEQSEGLEYSINQIYEEFGPTISDSNKSPTIQDLFKHDYVKFEGNNRHLDLLRMMESLIQRNKAIMSEEEIKEISKRMNQEHFKPPLDEKEFERQWKDAKNFISRNAENVETTDKSNIPDLLESIKKRWLQVFKDQFNRYYVTICINDHIECIPLDSDRFRKIVQKEYYEKEKKPLNKDRVSEIVSLLETQMIFDEKVEKFDLSLRVASRKAEPSVFYYDLTNLDWDIVKISSGGWEIIKSNKIPLFKRYETNCSQQVIPSSSSKQDNEKGFIHFLRLFNLQSNDDKILLSVYLVSLFIPNISKAILVVKGDGGGAKTTAFKMLKRIVDPSSVDNFSFSKQYNDIIQTLEHQYVVFFDNISSISNYHSDLLCKAVTGAGFSKRALYTDDGDIVYNFKRCIGINGINLVTTRADFLDRSLIIKFKRIEENARRKEQDIEREFEWLKPFVLGHIFDVLVTVLRYREEHRDEKILEKLPRMADFAEWGEIISRCLGYPENKFTKLYSENILEQNDEVIESSPVAEAILIFMDERNSEWNGSPTQLHKELGDVIDQIKPELRRSNLWPKTSSELSKKINEVTPNLKAKGIDAITGERDTKGGRIIKLMKKTEYSVSEKRDFNSHIHRIGYTDRFECDKCPLIDDIHHMRNHICV
ncbi:bifunctional DNA primase/polymerase [Candidatus Nitrosocosmicus agrestis]|uniref:bifunctional DNA primase/polymerase n=1 Tax=Candidatus Nitrosocosmicus agrestis TaxID=2563600 RepID=UPI00122E80AD|nr:bifunctional DNA primase/polymerase [Candidatus Nitrosocosmicus sp. SS]KAA2279386.1 hypothetical protein F1Z66_13430 [Candidatus Nitrosocosmicus sp. SS]KAF0868074.1 hypothetical protein E5N71_11975 [Candidatus Nitrosocosmicus sp. SS]